MEDPSLVCFVIDGHCLKNLAQEVLATSHYHCKSCTLILVIQQTGWKHPKFHRHELHLKLLYETIGRLSSVSFPEIDMNTRKEQRLPKGKEFRLGIDDNRLQYTPKSIGRFYPFCSRQLGSRQSSTRKSYHLIAIGTVDRCQRACASIIRPQGGKS